MTAGPLTTGKSDVVGSVLSGVCMVHCMSAPAILTVLPAAASVLGRFHPVLLGAVALVAGWAFIPGFRHHRHVEVVLLAALGLGLLALAALAFPEGRLETLLSLAGAGLMLTAHLRNRALLQEPRPAEPAGGTVVAAGSRTA